MTPATVQPDDGDSRIALLRHFLEQHDAPCPVCGYNLRRLETTTCPECGATLELRVGSADLKMGRWIAMLLTFALPGGFGALLSGFILVLFRLSGFGRGEAFERLWPLLLLALFAFVLLSLIIVQRRRFWRLRPAKQIVWLVGAAGLMLAVLSFCFWWMWGW